MATADGTAGNGVRAFFATASPQSWTEMPYIRDTPQLPNRERDSIESTIHGTTGERTNISGLATVNDFEALFRADLTTGGVHLQLKAHEVAQTELWVRIEIPIDADLSTTQFIIYQQRMRVKKWNLLSPIDGLKELEVAFVYTGGQFFMTGASARP